MPQDHLRLLLVRHGQTEWNAASRLQGHSDIPLDETGLAQAQAVAPAIVHALNGEKPLAIVSSDLRRAYQTAQAIHSAVQAACPTPVALLPEKRLREMHFGDWQGMSYAEIQAAHPQALAEWEADSGNHPPPGGETLEAFARRVTECYTQWTRDYPCGTLVVVAHGGTLRIIVAHALGVPPERSWQFALSNTGWAELNLYPAGVILNKFNITGHWDE